MGDKDIHMSIKMGSKSFKGIYDLSMGRTIDESDIEDLCRFADARFDCADFRVVVLLKTIYAYSELLSERIKARIKETLISFKYWHDEPGEDSLCTWSENHQLIFHTCEYMAGHFFKKELFTNASMTGEAHVKKAEAKLHQWFEHKFTYGFIEWHSNTYYEEDIAQLALLIDHAPDEEIAKKAAMIMDLLLLDMAMYSYEGTFNACSGRCYEEQKKDGRKQDTLDIYRHAFGDSEEAYDYERLSSVFILCRKYQVPEVIKAIARNSDTVILKDSMGLDLSELKRELDMTDKDSGGAFAWQMEAFTNPQTINLTLDMFNAYQLYTNDFLKDLKMVNIPLLRKLGLLPRLVRLLNPTTAGVAIQRSNSYTYKTKDFMLSTSMRYHPGEFGDQQHIWHGAMPGNIHVFTTHPGAPFFDDNARNFSPSYWVGNGILPDSVQHENVHMSIYKVNQRRGMLERERLKLTHAFFPRERFDEVVTETHGVFGRKGDSYMALIGSQPLEYTSGDEILQRGDITAWVCEMGSKERDASFEAFMEEIKKADMILKGLTLSYKDLSLTYKGKFTVKGNEEEHQYQRLETPYITTERKPEVYKLQFENHYLTLNMKQLTREFSN